MVIFIDDNGGSMGCVNKPLRGGKIPDDRVIDGKDIAPLLFDQMARLMR